MRAHVSCGAHARLLSTFDPVRPKYEFVMETSLIESGIGEDVVSVLIEQKVLNEHVFRAMKEEHLKRLLQCDGMPVGSHALLWERWETRRTDSPCTRHDISRELIVLMS